MLVNLGLRRAGNTLAAQVRAILRKYGTDAHVYLPGIGVINGLTAGNYLDSAGTTAATVDNPVGLVVDSGGINALQATTANKPILRLASGRYSWQFDGTDYLSLGSVPFQSTDNFAIILAASATTNTSQADVFSQRNAASTNAIYPLIRFDAGGKVRALYRDDALGTELLEVASGYAANTAYVISTIKSGNLKRLRQNTVEAPTSNTASGTTTLTTSTIGASNSITVTAQLVGRVYPVIAIKGTVTDADLLILEKFVGALSGVTI